MRTYLEVVNSRCSVSVDEGGLFIIEPSRKEEREEECKQKGGTQDFPDRSGVLRSRVQILGWDDYGSLHQWRRGVMFTSRDGRKLPGGLSMLR
jgi:hypothetical protein